MAKWVQSELEAHRWEMLEFVLLPPKKNHESTHARYLQMTVSIGMPTSQLLVQVDLYPDVSPS